MTPGNHSAMIKVVRSRVDPVDVTVDGPTRGASENASDSQWDASTRLALVVRIVIWLIPTVGAFAGLYLIVDLLYRPAGTIGLALWFAQGVAVGTMISVVLDRWARRLLPLVALLKMSMIFPDEAPSRFAVALRAGSFRRIERRVAEVNRNGLRTVAFGTGEYDRLSLPFLANNADIQPGDLLVTSGLGGAFPSGYPVAVVENVTRLPQEPFAEVTATPAAALDQVREVMLIWVRTQDGGAEDE